MRAVSVAVVLGCLALAARATAAPAAARAARATFVGDSVPASITYVPAAQAELERGLSVRLDLAVCRRLVQPSCTFQGAAPATALHAVQTYGRSLGRALVVDVGYNDDPRGYGQGIDRVMRAALADGATNVVWLTLREAGPYTRVYHATNLQIVKAAKRWPQLLVADWNAYSAGKPWFRADGLHPSVGGATRLAAYIRSFLVRSPAKTG